MARTKVRKPQDAVIYTRVSTEDQVENTSLDSQEDACRRFCADNGLNVARVFREEGVSAKTLQRPALTKLREYVRKNRRSVSDVVVRYASRLSRDTEDFFALKSEFTGLGVRITVIDVPRDAGPYGDFRIAIDTATAELDNALKSQAVTEAMRRRTEGGRWCHQAPLGYQRGGPGEPSLAPDRETADLVATAFQLVAQGDHTQTEIVEILNDAGLRTKRGNPTSRQTFNQLIRNPLYMGIIEQDCYDPPISVPGDFEPIVDRVTFERIQAQLNGHKSPSAPRCRDNPAFPLLGLSRCEECGKALRASFTTKKTGAKYGYYDCQTRGCRNGRSRDEKLHESFTQTLDNVLPSPSQVDALDAALGRAAARREKATATTRRQLEAHVATMRARVDRIEDMYIDGKIDDVTYRERLPVARDDLRAAERRLDEHIEAQHIDVGALRRFARYILVNLKTVWEDASVTTRKAIQGSIFPNGITVSGGEVRTAETSPLFRHLRDFGDDVSSMVTPTGIEPVFSA